MSGVRTRALPALLVGLGALVLLTGCIGTVQTPGTQVHPSPDIGFENVTEESGLDYAGAVGGQIGGGNTSVYAMDADRDGWMDLVTAGGHQPAFWNNENGTFERSETFPEISAPVKSVTVVDYDGDGWRDLIMFPEYSDPIALRNDDGTFRRTEIGLGNLSYPLGGAAADYDGDGDQDLLVYQSGDWENGKPNGYFFHNGTVVDDNGNWNLLYENVGGEYELVEDAGLTGQRWSLAASFVDLTGDGRPDIHVANDYNTDVLYVNQGNGTFDERFLQGNTSRNGMSSAVSDVNGDAIPDVFVTNIEIPISKETVGPQRYETYRRLFSYVVHSSRTEGNTLMINDGNGDLNDVASAYGVQVGGWGWAASHADLNNDGERDIFHATQNVVTIDQENPVYTYPMLFERTGDNFTRLDTSEIGFDEDDGRGMVTLDYDRDGRLDIVSANYGTRFSVYENTANTTGVNAIEFLAVEGDGSVALGASIEVDAGYAGRTVFQHSRTDYLSQDPRENHVGLGTNDAATLTVTWPDGTQQRFEDVPAGQYVHLHRNGTVETVAAFDR